MERWNQFSLRHLFVELTLIAVTIGVGRAALYPPHDPEDPRIIFSLVALCTLPILGGAVIGGLFGNFAAGVKWGVGVLVMLLLIGLLLPAVQA